VDGYFELGYKIQRGSSAAKRHFSIAFNGTTATPAVRSHFVCFEKAG